MSKILSKKISKTMVSKRMSKLCQKKHKNKSVKIVSIKNVQNNVQKHSIKNGVLKSVEYFVENEMSIRMSKWCQ
jgi:hypothetical protein